MTRFGKWPSDFAIIETQLFVDYGRFVVEKRAHVAGGVYAYLRQKSTGEARWVRVDSDDCSTPDDCSAPEEAFYDADPAFVPYEPGPKSRFTRCRKCGTLTYTPTYTPGLPGAPTPACSNCQT